MLKLLIYNARQQIIALPKKFAVCLDLNPHVAFHLIGWKQNLKALRSKCCKIFKKNSPQFRRILPELRSKEAAEIFVCH